MGYAPLPAHSHGVVINGRTQTCRATLHEVSGVKRNLETDEVIAEEPDQDFLAMLGIAELLPAWPGDMPEMGYGPLRIRFSEQAGNEAEMIIVDPDSGIFDSFFENRFCKQPVRPLIFAPEWCVGDDAVRLAVEERPENQIAEPVVIVFHSVVGKPDPSQGICGTFRRDP